MKRFVLSNGLVIPAALAVVANTRLGMPSEYAINLIKNDIKKHIAATHDNDEIPVSDAINAAHQSYMSFVQDLASLDFVTLCISGFNDSWNVLCGQIDSNALSQFYDNDRISVAEFDTLQDWLNKHRIQQLVDGTGGLYTDYHKYIADVDRWKNKRSY